MRYFLLSSFVSFGASMCQRCQRFVTEIERFQQQLSLLLCMTMMKRNEAQIAHILQDKHRGWRLSLEDRMWHRWVGARSMPTIADKSHSNVLSRSARKKKERKYWAKKKICFFKFRLPFWKRIASFLLFEEIHFHEEYSTMLVSIQTEFFPHLVSIVEDRKISKQNKNKNERFYSLSKWYSKSQTTLWLVVSLANTDTIDIVRETFEQPFDFFFKKKKRVVVKSNFENKKIKTKTESNRITSVERPASWERRIWL